MFRLLEISTDFTVWLELSSCQDVGKQMSVLERCSNPPVSPEELIFQNTHILFIRSNDFKVLKQCSFGQPEKKNLKRV